MTVTGCEVDGLAVLQSKVERFDNESGSTSGSEVEVGCKESKTSKALLMTQPKIEPVEEMWAGYGKGIDI
jgi:hypothetical protein